MAERATADHMARSGTPAAPPPTRVVVGVDGTTVNDTAVTWAAREARRHRCPLVLLGAGSGDASASAPQTESSLTRDMLETVRDRVRQRDGLDVELEVGIGEPSHALVRFADERDLLVVGKRGGHPLSRTVLGSTSIATVGRSIGPVAVVPEQWASEEHDDAPIVVGLDEPSHEAVLWTALPRAEDLSLDVVVVRGWEPTAFGHSPEDVAERGTKEKEILESHLLHWRREFPDVTIRSRSEPLAPAVALLGAATSAELLVLGRRTPATHPGGLSLGSTIRRVLHHATCPVLVVPLT